MAVRKLVGVSNFTYKYLLKIVNADLKAKEDLRNHAHSHGDIQYNDPDIQTAVSFLEKLDKAPFENAE